MTNIIHISGLGQEGLIEKSVIANYSKNSRPVVGGNETINVGMMFVLTKIEKLVSGTIMD